MATTSYGIRNSNAPGNIRVHRLSSLADNREELGRLTKSVHDNQPKEDDAPNFGESADAFGYVQPKANNNIGIYVDQVTEEDGTSTNKGGGYERKHSSSKI